MQIKDKVLLIMEEPVICSGAKTVSENRIIFREIRFFSRD